MLKLNQSNEELNRTRNKLYETKKKLGKAGDDIYKLEEIQEKYYHQNNKVKRLKSELNKKK